MLANILWLALTSQNGISSIAYRAWDHDIMSSAVHYGTVSCKSELIMEYTSFGNTVHTECFSGFINVFSSLLPVSFCLFCFVWKTTWQQLPRMIATSKLYRFTVHYRLNWNARVPSEKFHLEHSLKSDFQTENWISSTNSKLIMKDGVSARKQQ